MGNKTTDFKLVYEVLKDIPGYKKGEIIDFGRMDSTQKKVGIRQIVWKYSIDEMENLYQDFFKKIT